MAIRRALGARKFTQNHQKSRFEEVRGALGRGLGAMLAPKRAFEFQRVPKARSRATLGVVETSGSRVSMY